MESSESLIGAEALHELTLVWKSSGFRLDSIERCSQDPPLCPGCLAMGTRGVLAFDPARARFVCGIHPTGERRPHEYAKDLAAARKQRSLHPNLRL